MFAHSEYARDLADIQRRMQALERRLERLADTATRASSNVSSSVTQATDRMSEALGAALAEVADRFRGQARFVGDEAARFSNQAVRRISHEVEHRPLLILTVAVAIGLLVGLSGRRR